MSREKQIEELTNELIFTHNYGTLDAVAKHLYEKGYRKQNTSEGDPSNELIEIIKPYVSGFACEEESGSCEFTDCRSCNALNLAKEIYNAGYRKQSEGEWEAVQREWDFDPFFYIDYVCSVCGSREQNKRNFCPNCGAKMKGGE